jgi:hypothetical protein
LVVISLYEPRPREPLAQLLASLRRFDAGLPYDLAIVVNRTGSEPLLLPDVAGARVLERPNQGMNIGAWDHAWRALPGYEGYLFLQDECFAQADGWLADFVQAAADPQVGLVGESWNAGWDRPWDEMRRAVAGQAMKEHLIDGAPANRVDVYTGFLRAHAVDPGQRGGHLRSLVWYARRQTLEAMGGFLQGANYGECIAAEIGASKRVEQLGRKAVQLGAKPFCRFRHVEWQEVAPGRWKHGVVGGAANTPGKPGSLMGRLRALLGSLRNSAKMENAGLSKVSKLEFVTFHVALSPDKAVHPNQTLAHREYLGMVDMMFASARLFHPRARRVVLSDRATSFARIRLLSLDRVERSPMDPAKLMLERAQAQLRHVQASKFKRPIVFLDSDILVNGPFGPVFERDFDVALTWRPQHPEQPINGGLLILNNRRPDVGRRFFEQYVRRYKDYFAHEQGGWFGDQLALRDCVGLTVEAMAERDLVEVDGCRVLLLPCDTYNYSPPNRFHAIEGELTEKLVLHFKGERKRLMQPFWRATLQPRGSRAPWVQRRAERAREWLREQVELELQAKKAAGQQA